MTFAAALRATLSTMDFPGRFRLAAWELTEREPVTIDATRPVHAASTIKVLVMIAALRRVQHGAIGLDTDVELPAPAERVGGFGVLRELTGVRRMSFGDLITLMIIISDNTATNAVIDTVGIPRINECAHDLGLTDTVLRRRLMDADPDTEPNVTTALDQARVLDRLATGSALPAALTDYAVDRLARQQVRDRLPADLPEAWSCWNKTGELLGLRHDVALIGRDRPEVAVAVLVDELTDSVSISGYRNGPGCVAISQVGTAVRTALDATR